MIWFLSIFAVCGIAFLVVLACMAINPPEDE